MSGTARSAQPEAGADAHSSQAERDLGLRFARGFLLLPSGQPAPNSVPHWLRYPIPGYTLYVDPRVPVENASGGEREVWLVGDAFDPERGIYDRLSSVLVDGNLLDHLDRLAGRFLLIARDRTGRVEIYHDAMGSRSVFHGAGTVASHAKLVAEQLNTGLRDWVIPFITSRGYMKRDVKFLPGLDSPFEDVEQLTPNTRLVLPSGAVERYWPREPLSPSTDEAAVSALVGHMRGLSAYLRTQGVRPVLGLSAGRDSRCALADLITLSPELFTFVRGASGSGMSTADSRIAARLAEAAGLPLEVIKIEVPPHLDRAATPFGEQFRTNTGHVRGNNSGWIEHLWESNPDRDAEVFVRGFGGEIMRGFQGSKQMSSTSANALAATYDVNAGSIYTRRAFAHFREVTGWDESPFLDYSPDDLFYWEHRMGIWGSSSFTEADMAIRGMPAFNSRNLFTRFLPLDPLARVSGKHFKAATALLAPVLADIAYSS